MEGIVLWAAIGAIAGAILTMTGQGIFRTLNPIYVRSCSGCRIEYKVRGRKELVCLLERTGGTCPKCGRQFSKTPLAQYIPPPPPPRL